MGRLIESVSNVRSRLMIEAACFGWRKQNPAYKFAADKPFPVKRKGLFFVIGFSGSENLATMGGSHSV